VLRSAERCTLIVCPLLSLVTLSVYYCNGTPTWTLQRARPELLLNDANNEQKRIGKPPDHLTGVWYVFRTEKGMASWA
jgi:hypothetical protein